MASTVMLRLFARHLLVLPILVYQKLVSPLLPGSCIYRPTCSAYAREALLRHGLAAGALLALARVLRCAGGLFVGGDDPVPSRFTFREIGAAYRRFGRRRPP